MNTANSAVQTFRYEVDNLGSININLDQPVSPMALPQEDASENVLVKMEGNTQSVTINWKVANSSSQPLTSTTKLLGSAIQTDINEFYAGSSPSATWASHSYTDSGEIVSWILNEFQGKDLTDRYLIKIPNMGIMEGFITRVSANIEGSSPVVYSCSLTFIMGNVISMYETDAPSEPRNVSAGTVNASGGSTGTQTRIYLSWTLPTDSATAVTHYGIWIKDDTHSYLAEPDYTVSVSTADRNSELAGHVSGGSNYEVSWLDDTNWNATHFVKEDGSSFTATSWDTVRGEALVSGRTYTMKVAAANVAGGYGLKSDEKVAVMP